MTILVTGSAGHLGEALMLTLRATERRARGFDIKASAFTDCAGSIADRTFVRDCMDGVETILHTATLHKPHVATHTKQDFVDTNVTGTLVLLEEAVRAGARQFVFTSTTSTFGAAMNPASHEPAAWVTEEVVPAPKNIYGVTKLAAEDLCALFAREHRLPVVVLRTSRFFPEPDDDPEMRAGFAPENAQANELLYRRADIADIVEAHLLAVEKARDIGFGRFIVSATTPFSESDMAALRADAPSVVRRLFPEYEALYAARGWRMFASIDRSYVNAAAHDALGWRPTYDFAHVLASLRAGEDFRSPLARAIGIKGYHGADYTDGLYPVR
jgi:UDP-glucose 4-epimerase